MKSFNSFKYIYNHMQDVLKMTYLTQITRKKFLNASGALLAAESLPEITSAADESGGQGTEPPDVILINTDDLGQRLESYGVETVETPTIQALAERGVQFENAFTASPSCSQSRSALATG